MKKGEKIMDKVERPFPTEDRPYPTDEELEELYLVNANACLSDEEFEHFLTKKAGPRPLEVGQIYLINGHRFRVKKIAKKDVVLREMRENV